MRNNKVDDNQERAKANIDLYERQGELGGHSDEDDELGEARDELRNYQHEQVAAVIVHR